MAPDSRFRRHQLGEVTVRGRKRMLLKTTLPVFLLLVLCTTQSNAKTEPVKGSCNVLATYSFQHSPLRGDYAAFASLSSLPELSPTSPAERWSSRIQIHIPDEPTIQRYIRHFEREGRPTVVKALERSRPYLSVMTEILEAHGVPPELLAIVLVESCFDGEATCRGAGGYWQLLAATARTMGLRVDRWVDERFDPVKSTEAAAKYLRSFYERYQSWALVIAAFNAGDTSIDAAMRKRRTSDFWELARHGGMPRRTRAYVPKVLAVAQILGNLETYGFIRPQANLVYDFESVRVQSPLKLSEIAGWINVPVDTMQELNPSLRLDALPPDCNVSLNIPSGARDQFDLAYQQFLRR